MLAKLKNYFRSIHRSDRGAMSVETILIIAIIAVPLIIVLFIFRQKIVGWFSNQSSDLEQRANQGTGYN